MQRNRIPTGALVIAQTKDGEPVYEAKWRSGGRQIKRRLGLAWLERGPDGKWRKRRGRSPEGYLDERGAAVAMAKRIEGFAAEEAERRRRAEAEVNGVVTFEDAAEAWHRRAERRQRKPSTLKGYRQVIDAYIKPARKGEAQVSPTLRIKRAPFALLPLGEITVQDCRSWFSSMPHGRSRERLLMVTRAILNFAAAEGWINSNPAQKVDRDTIVYDGDYDHYEPAEVERLVNAADSEQDAALFATAALTGLRAGEVVALRWRDLDIGQAKLTVRQALSHGVLVDSTKGGKARTVPVVPRLADQLLALRERDCLTAPEDLVFPGKGGNPLDTSALRRRYKAAVKRAKLRHLPFHSLRHYFGSRAIEAGATLVQLRDWMGHGDLKVTSRYLHSKSRLSDAELLTRGFAVSEAESLASAS